MIKSSWTLAGRLVFKMLMKLLWNSTVILRHTVLPVGKAGMQFLVRGDRFPLKTNLPEQIGGNDMVRGFRNKKYRFILNASNRAIFKTTIFCLVFQVFSVSLYATSGLKVEKMSFIGNQSISDNKLKQILKTEEGKTFNPRFLKLDQILLTNYYNLQGYLDVYVSSSFSREANKIHVEYHIKEGTRYYLKEIQFKGNQLTTVEDLRKQFTIKNSEPYQKEKIDAGLNAIESYYLNNGKPYAVFSDNREVIDDSLIILTIYIQENETVYIQDIHYEGMDLVKSFLIRRELKIEKGDIYSREKIEKSQRNIYSTGLFKFVDFRLTPINNDRTRVQLTWTVVEKKPLWVGFRFGVGHESREETSDLTTFDFTAEAGHRNLFGTARSISVSAVPSFIYSSENPGDPKKILNPRNQYSFTYVEPYVLNTRTPGIFKVSYSQESRPISPADLNILSVSFNISHSYENYWSYTSGISFQRVETPSDSILEVVSQGQNKIYAFSINPTKDRRDNVINPQQGYLLDFRNRFIYATSEESQQGRTRLITNTFYKFIAQWNRYQRFMLNENWILASRLRIGGMVEANGGQLIRRIPLTERFFLGGASTVRGYQEQSIGGFDNVVESNGDSIQVPIGGKYMALANLELRIPLIWLLQGEVFLDAGNIWQEFDKIQPLSYKAGVGAGLAIITPFGPIRFDYGIKLFPEEGESFGEFHIGISFAF